MLCMYVYVYEYVYVYVQVHVHVCVCVHACVSLCEYAYKCARLYKTVLVACFTYGPDQFLKLFYNMIYLLFEKAAEYTVQNSWSCALCMGIPFKKDIKSELTTAHINMLIIVTNFLSSKTQFIRNFVSITFKKKHLILTACLCFFA